MNMNKINAIVIHCSATRPSVEVHAATINRWHRKRGFKEIGYHFVIPRNGFLELGRDQYEIGTHAKRWNEDTLGICLAGGLDEETWKPTSNYTDGQWAALYTLLRIYINKYPDIKILGHNEIEGVTKACPCFSVQEWLTFNGLAKYSYLDQELTNVPETD